MLTGADTDTAAHTGLRIAERTGTEPTTVMSMIAEQRAATRHETPPLEPPHPQPNAAEPEPELAVDEPAELDRSPTDPAVEVEPTETRQHPVTEVTAENEPGEDEQPIPHWSTRAYGALDDRALAEQTETARQQAQHAEAQRAATEAGDGPEVRAVEDNLARLREQAATARAADEVETTWRSTLDRAAAAAEQRALAEHDRDQLGRFARGKRAELTNQIEHLREQETTAQAEAAERRAARLAEQQTEHDARSQTLAREHQLRAELPEHLREQEQHERTEALQPAEVTTGQQELSPGEPTAGLEQQAQIESQAAAELDHHELDPG